MSSQGSVIARVYTSDAYIPLSDVPVIFSIRQETEQQLLAIRFTDHSGLTAPVIVETPDRSDSQSPGAVKKPFALIDLTAGMPGYNRVTARDVQIFPRVETIQDLQLQPVSSDDGKTDVILQENEQNL